ncbi:MAG: hypothetical protein U9P10_11230 [Thermodesulfobacteriota bacterium]|nr:hypothetical protein [Thermodesulfobacteriota bacterium]
MDKCPACNAKYRNKRICYRCKTDLGPLLNIENSAFEHKQRAAAAYRADNFKQMFYHARRSVSLYYSEDGAKLLSIAAVLEKKFSLALHLWEKINQAEQDK